MTDALEIYDYQIEARNATWKAYRNGAKSALLVMATGTGKTITAGSIVEPIVKKHNKKVLLVAHRGELLDQAARAFRRFAMSVGYEKASARVNEKMPPDVTLAMVQTLKGKRLERFDRGAFYTVIIDEGHHGAADSYKAILSYFDARVLALSATPDRADGKPLSDVYECIPYRLEIGEAVERGILCPITLLDVAVQELQLDQIKTSAGDFAQGELEQEVLRDAVLHGMAKPLSEEARGRRTCAFLPGVASARRFVEVLAGYGVTAVAVDGSMKDGERKTAFAQYESGEASVICCSNLLDEGWDSPRTDCVALCSPTKSRARVVQRIGRGTRRVEGKNDLLVMSFVPGSITKAKLAAPEDALAGCASARPAIGLTYKIRERERADAIAADEAARIDAQRHIVQTMGVGYSIARMSLAEFLTAAQVPTDGPEPTTHQLDRLDKLGFSKADVLAVKTSREASAAIEACNRRANAGLPTLKMSRKLLAAGLNPDMPHQLAQEVMARLAANGWRPLASLKRDPRFSCDANEPDVAYKEVV